MLETWIIVTKDATGVLVQHEVDLTAGVASLSFETAERFRWREIVLACKKSEIFCTKWLTNGGQSASVKA